MTRKLKKIFLALGLAGLLGGVTELPAQTNINLKTEQTSQIRPNFNISFNYLPIAKDKVEANSILSYLYRDSFDFFKSDNYPLISAEKEEIIFDLFKQIQQKKIDYNSLINKTKLFSENEKFYFLNTLGSYSGSSFYEEDFNKKFISQEEFLDRLAIHFHINEDEKIVNCNQISYHLGKLAEDMGFDVSSVSGTLSEGHAYNLLKLEGGRLAIIDYGNFFIIPTQNVETALLDYHKKRGFLSFQHSFFEGNKFRYWLINKDGKNFLDFLGYDYSLNSFKNSLFQKEQFVNSNPKINLNLTQTEDISSMDLNFKGFSITGGQINGGAYSPFKKINLIKGGFKGDFVIDPSSNLSYSGNILYGDIESILEPQYDFQNNLIGAECDLELKLKDFSGFDLNSKFALGYASALTFKPGSSLFSRGLFDLGIFYNLPLGRNIITPYSSIQSALFFNNLKESLLTPSISEIQGGIRTEIQLTNRIKNKLGGDISLIINPYVGWKPWEHEIGGNVRMGNNKAGLEATMSVNSPTYWACPKKCDLAIKGNVTIKNIEGNLTYTHNSTDYSGEINTENNFLLGLRFNF
jgi:hypothetical protein